MKNDFANFRCIYVEIIILNYLLLLQMNLIQSLVAVFYGTKQYLVGLKRDSRSYKRLTSLMNIRKALLPSQIITKQYGECSDTGTCQVFRKVIELCLYSHEIIAWQAAFRQNHPFSLSFLRSNQEKGYSYERNENITNHRSRTHPHSVTTILFLHQAHEHTSSFSQ